MSVHTIFPDCKYLYVVDDSGDFAPVVKIEQGQFKLRQPVDGRRYGAIGSFIIRKDAIPDFSTEWIALQLDIQRSIGLPYLPPIHMRLMWARDPKSRPKYMTNRKKLKNPYHATSSAQEIEAWVTRALSIIAKCKKAGALKPIPEVIDLHAYIEDWNDYFSREQYLNEYLWLLKTAGRKTMQAYLSAAGSPLLALLAEKLVKIIAELGSREGTVGVLFDNTSDVAGFEISDPLKWALSRSARNIKVLGPVGNIGLKGDVFPLIQASDVIAYFLRRTHDGDEVSQKLYEEYIGGGRRGILRKMRFRRSRKARATRRAVKEFNNDVVVGIAQRYHLAYNNALKRDDKGVFTSVAASPDELITRLDRAKKRANKKLIDGISVSILKEPHGDEFELRLRNP